MSTNRDHELLGFLLGELTLMKRLDLRMRLAFSASARRRLTELERVAGAVAGAIGVGGAAGFHANKGVKRRRLLFIDLAVAALMLSMISAGATVVWRTLHPAPESCATDAAGYPIPSSPSVKSGAAPGRFPKTVQPAK